MPAAIETQHLTKRYDATTALDDISFDVQSGEIMGFLGPNGAGKTTTLRILTGLLSPSSGSVKIEGMNVETQSLEIRKRIGYLPENVALYPELRVEEFLSHRAALKSVPRAQRRARVAEVADRCQLADVRRKLCGRLSKGYRQRVGLADALIGHPSILILDEPTVGLDPNQIRQARDLIKSLGQSTTIFLSTHILPEVEMICQRVTIISKGKIVAVDTPAKLRQRMSGGKAIRVELRGDPAQMKMALRQLPGVTEAHRQEEIDGFTVFKLDVVPEVDVREAIFKLASERNWTLRQLSQTAASLEDVFIQLTTTESHE